MAAVSNNPRIESPFIGEANFSVDNYKKMVVEDISTTCSNLYRQVEEMQQRKAPSKLQSFSWSIFGKPSQADREARSSWYDTQIAQTRNNIKQLMGLESRFIDCLNTGEDPKGKLNLNNYKELLISDSHFADMIKDRTPEDQQMIADTIHLCNAELPALQQNAGFELSSLSRAFHEELSSFVRPTPRYSQRS